MPFRSSSGRYLSVLVGLGIIVAMVGVAAPALRDDARPDLSLTGLSPDAALEAVNDDPTLARGLPRAELEVDTAAPLASLREALNEAEIVVRGRVSGADFLPDYWIHARF